MSDTPKHPTYNSKRFLAPQSINSCAVVHAKVKDCGTAILRISDCNNSIRLWNDMKSKKEALEMLDKIDNLKAELNGLRDFIDKLLLSQ